VLNNNGQPVQANVSTYPVIVIVGKVVSVDSFLLDIERNYISTLKTFATENACDYAISSVYNIGITTSQSTAAANNLTSAYAAFLVPNTFLINGTTYTVPRKDVIFLECGYIYVYWGTASASSSFYSSASAYHNSSTTTYFPKFDQLKSAIGNNSYNVHFWYYSSSSVSDGATASGRLSRYSDDYYRFLSYPYSTSYDYWYNSGGMYYTLWAFKLPTLGTSPYYPFPTEPVIPKQEFYY
jgi:hypothetical protein